MVFSVGVLLFEELTGRHPFGQTTARRFARIKKGELGSGVQYFPEVPTELRSMLVQAMGPFPEERFASLAELRQRAGSDFGRPPPRVVDEEGAERTRSFQRPVMFAPGIALPADTFSPSVPPPLPMSRPIPTALLATPPMPPLGRFRRRRRFAVVERVGWLALGVLAALVVTRLSSRAPSARRGHRRRAPVGARRSRLPSLPRLPWPIRRRWPRRRRLCLAPAPAVAFDAALAANAGAQAAHKCFEPIDHSVAFGAGLLFAPDDDSKIHRAFLSPDEPLYARRRAAACKRRWWARARGAPPDARVIVEARYKLRPDGSVELKLHSF